MAQVEALARRPDLRFFHWEIEFPEVFFGFVDADERQLKHKDQIAGRARRGSMSSWAIRRMSARRRSSRSRRS